MLLQELRNSDDIKRAGYGGLLSLASWLLRRTWCTGQRLPLRRLGFFISRFLRLLWRRCTLRSNTWPNQHFVVFVGGRNQWSKSVAISRHCTQATGRLIVQLPAFCRCCGLFNSTLSMTSKIGRMQSQRLYIGNCHEEIKKEKWGWQVKAAIGRRKVSDHIGACSWLNVAMCSSFIGQRRSWIASNTAGNGFVGVTDFRIERKF